MTNYREILRMNSLGFNKTEIAQSLQCSRTTVRTVIRLAEEHNLQYPLPNSKGVVQLQEQLGNQLFIRLPAAERPKAVRGPLRVIRLPQSLRVDLESLILRNHPESPNTEIMNPPIMVLHAEADLPRQNLIAVFINENLAILNRNHLRPLGRLFLPGVFQRGKNQHTALRAAAPGHRDPGTNRPDLNQDIRLSPTAFTLC